MGRTSGTFGQNDRWQVGWVDVSRCSSSGKMTVEGWTEKQLKSCRDWDMGEWYVLTSTKQHIY